jgi:predicted patatin/cPLA2 family phospholipase
MDSSQTKIISLVESLLIPEAKKQALLEKLKKGVSKEIILEIKETIDEAVKEFEQQIDSEIKQLQDKLNSTVSEFNKNFQEIENTAKAEEKAAIKKKESEDIENIRNKIKDAM